MSVIFTCILCITLTLAGVDNAVNSVDDQHSEPELPQVINRIPERISELKAMQTAWREEKNEKYLKTALFVSSEMAAAIYFSKRVKDPIQKALLWISLGGVTALHCIYAAAETVAKKAAKKEMRLLTQVEVNAQAALQGPTTPQGKLYASLAKSDVLQAEIYRDRIAAATGPSLMNCFFSIFKL